MEVLILLIFVSLVLAASAVGFFAWNLKDRNHEHADRLTLLPLSDDVSGQRASEASPERERSERSRGEADSSLGAATAAAVAPRRIAPISLSAVGGPPPGVWGEAPARTKKE